MRPRRTGIALMSTAVVLAFAWQASADDVGRSLVPAGGASPTSLNVVDGNLRTEVPLIKWYARGGSAVSLSLFHNAKGGSVDALMPRPPSSAMEATVGEGGSCTPGWHKLACAFVNHESGVESTLSPPVNVLFEYKWTLVGESSELLPFYKATLTVPAVPLASNLDVVVYMTRSGGNQLFGPVAKVAAAARRDLTIEAFDDEKLVKPYRDARLRLRDRDPVDFGQGWGHSFGTKVVSASTNDTRIRTGSGDETPCAAVAEGQPAQLTLKEDDTWTLAGPHRTLSTFDAAGLLTSWADGAGNVVTVKRRADGSVESVVDPTNRSIELVYGENGRVARIRDPLGRSWRFSYDDDGNLVQIDYPELAGRTHSRRFTYGPGHTIASESFAGRVWRFDYDESRRLTAWRNPLGAAWTVGYDRDAGTTTLKAPLGQQTIYTVSQNRVASVQDEAGYSEQYSYDDDGNVVSLLDRNGNAWEATFDRRGNRLTATNPLGATRSWTYDAGDDVLTSTDALDHTMAYAYNAQGRTTSWKDALGRTRTASYDAYGQRTSLTDASGRTTRFEYDDDGNTSSIVRPSGARTSFKHDRLGRIASFTDAAGGEATFEYDAWQRQTRETRADGSTMSFAYDLDGRLVGRTDGL
ncbi:RHS repeat protein, partial [bacterium]|nr:RHS repeat protein [bacterium]